MVGRTSADKVNGFFFLSREGECFIVSTKSMRINKKVFYMSHMACATTLFKRKEKFNNFSTYGCNMVTCYLICD